MLNRIFSSFDELAEKFGIGKSELSVMPRNAGRRRQQRAGQLFASNLWTGAGDAGPVAPTSRSIPASGSADRHRHRTRGRRGGWQRKVHLRRVGRYRQSWPVAPPAGVPRGWCMWTDHLPAPGGSLRFREPQIIHLKQKHSGTPAGRSLPGPAFGGAGNHVVAPA